LREVCEAVEDEIVRRGGQLAFPVQSSRNHIAAHYCAAPEDETSYAEGDLAKLDIGVHVDGFVVDTAISVNVGDRPENRPALAAAQAALDAGIAAAGPGVEIRQVSAAIERAIRSFGLNPLRNLCGHGVGRWNVHCPPPVPNLVLPGDGPAALEEGWVLAIEPFATRGDGSVIEYGPAEVFRLDPRAPLEVDGVDGEVLDRLRSFRGLPFARRQLSTFPRDVVEAALALLRERGLLRGYAPLVETCGEKVAQMEHTIRIGATEVEVLTL
jgi:methionyl aminopeptidase